MTKHSLINLSYEKPRSKKETANRIKYLDIKIFGIMLYSLQLFLYTFITAVNTITVGYYELYRKLRFREK